MKKNKYECIRCGYKTEQKNSIRDHLYKRQTPCATIVNNIELTDDIKEHIINYRLYHIPKEIKTKEIKNRVLPTKIISNIFNHFIYLVVPKENVLHNENVGKVGRTVTKDLTMNIPRLINYGEGSKVLLLSECFDSYEMEKKILDIFKTRFEKYVFGNEYFVGNFAEMKKIINDLIYEESLQPKKEIHILTDPMEIDLMDVDEEELDIPETYKPEPIM